MNRMYLAFAFLVTFTSANGAPATDSIIGTHKAEMGKPGNTVEISLVCEEETKCTLASVLKSGDRVLTDRQDLNKVRNVENLQFASNALKYAIDHQNQTPRSPDAIEAMNQLRPILSANPSVHNCWDLNYPTAEYMLACSLSGVPADAPSIYLFGTLLANCNDVFCRYIIVPMSRTK
ncbi:hypothetical protein SAMN06265795_11687 [Noviherbaspirillum humi]|uniref:Uncharacterized protein n=1 Tax=Noviherbaspirillum humi TaxID=1688639 RepID=A0A239KMA7_9BURK|nr:hypothetical protein [Noviherbaspirillum humi]SNT19130.1 hypothetical protein SAMN06265795_11687 [Noviherbaspirillum humi]